MTTIVTPSTARRADHRQQLLDLAAAEPGERLVHQQEARPPGERAGQLHQPQFLGGEAGGESPRRAAARPTRVERGLGGGECRAVRALDGIGADHRVLQYRHARERPHHLKRAADPEPADPVRLEADEILAIEDDPRPGRGRENRSSRLNSVVLPAPFGPMMPRIAAARRPRSPTSSTARSPPNDFDKPLDHQNRRARRRLPAARATRIRQRRRRARHSAGAARRSMGGRRRTSRSRTRQ